jgi:hypothetical protein
MISLFGAFGAAAMLCQMVYLALYHWYGVMLCLEASTNVRMSNTKV